MSGSHSPVPFKRKSNIIFFTLFLYFWFFYIDTGSDHISPEELESYKDELGDWVKENEEQLRMIQSERRENVVNTCRKYGLDRQSDFTSAVSELGEESLLSTDHAKLKLPYFYSLE